MMMVMVMVMVMMMIMIVVIVVIIIIIINGNRTEWSTIQGVIGQVILNQPSEWHEAHWKLQARLPQNCTTRSPITNCVNNKMQETFQVNG